MHYRGADFGYEKIGPVEDFLALRRDVKKLPTNEIALDALETPVTAVPAKP